MGQHTFRVKAWGLYRGVDKFVIMGGWDVVKCIYADTLPQNTMYHAHAHTHHYKTVSSMPCILIARFISQVLFAFFCLLKGGAYHTASYKL